MAKPPQDMFTPEPAEDDTTKPRIEVTLNVPDGVELVLTINGVEMLTDEDDENP